MTDTKKTPEELKQMRIDNLKKAREAKKEKEESSKPEQESKEEMVSVSKSSIEDLQKQIAEMKEKQGMLEQVADKKQLAAYYSRNKKKMPKIVQLRLFNDKVVVGWRTVENEVYQDPNTNAWKEKQSVEVVYEDGKMEKLQYLVWIRGYKHVEATIMSTKTDEKTGNDILKVRREDTGKVYDISVLYVN